MIIPTGKILLWTVKVLSIVLSILMLMFIFGNGFPDFGAMSPRETILLLCFTGLLVGMNLIWRLPNAAAWTIAGSSGAFWLVEVIYTASFWMHWFFLIFPLMSVLIFLSFKYPEYKFVFPKKSSKKKRGRPKKK